MKLPRVIHVTGLSGSGKTTVGNKLKAKYVVYDTDEIVEAANKELFRQYPKLFIQDEMKYFSKYFEMIEAFMDHLLDTYSTFVIVGFAIDVPQYVGKRAEIEGYVLDVDKKILYRRRASRDFQFLIDNQAKIKHIVEHEPVESMEQKLFMEGVHQSFPPPSFRQLFFNEQPKPKGYTTIKPEQLLKKLLSVN